MGGVRSEDTVVLPQVQTLIAAARAAGWDVASQTMLTRRRHSHFSRKRSLLTIAAPFASIRTAWRSGLGEAAEGGIVQGFAALRDLC